MDNFDVHADLVQESRVSTAGIYVEIYEVQVEPLFWLALCYEQCNYLDTNTVCLHIQITRSPSSLSLEAETRVNHRYWAQMLMFAVTQQS